MKNRLIHLLMLLLVTSLPAKANPVDMRTVCKVATQFVNANTRVPLRGAVDLQLATTYRTENGTEAFHIFNTPNGFVIVSADDCATPILGYSDEGRPFDLEDIPMQLQGYLQGFVEQIQYGVEHRLEADEVTARQWEMVQMDGHLNDQKTVTAVAPLVTSMWGQGCLYNSLCPMDSLGHCGHVLVGCVATSFSQVLHYWGFPVTGSGSHTYTPVGYPTQTADFGATTYDWEHMPDMLSDTSTSVEIDAVAMLMWHCGVAVDIHYGPNASGASVYDVIPALVNYFGYSDEMTMVEKNDYDAADWLTMMQHCLDLGRPIYYAASGNVGGHAFVCDGYDSNDLLHFNWGWYGNHNGYYALGAMNPGDYTFNTNQLAIINIHPNIIDEPIPLHFTTAGTWSEASNWQGGTLPEVTDEVFIDAPCQLDQNTTVAALTVSDGQSLTLQSGIILTVTGDLTNTVATGLVIEDSAQLVHNADNVQATVRKTITPFSGAGGWHLIALPLTGSIDLDSVGHLLEGEYDLYGYDEPTAYWRNQKTMGSGFTVLEATKGYSYANGAEVTLVFSGTLENGSTSVSVPLSYTVVAYLSGFNLVGNPFPCAATLDRPYYILSDDGTDINPNPISGNTPIPPCTAVFVKATEVGDRAVFTKVTQ